MYLDRAETEKYIRSHLEYAGGRQEIFTDKAMDEIFRESTGIPRRVNRICNSCLNLPFAMTGLCLVLLFFLSGNTGGAKGIGKCICEEFEEQRAKVCVIDLLDNPSPGWIDVGYY